MRIGYLVPEFPTQTHIFFWREVQALRAQGVGVRLISTRRGDPALCRHDFAAEAIKETRYLVPPSPRAWGIPPARLNELAASARYLRGLSAAGPKVMVRRLGLLVAALDLARFARADGLDHIHVHSAADAAHVAALSRCLGGPPYSLTLHGDLGVYGTDHDAKMAGAAFVDAVGAHLVRQIIAQVGLPAARVHSTCMGVDLGVLSQLGSARAFVPDSLHVVTVARLNPMKGHVHALAAVRQAVDAGADVRYTIAGEGEHRAVIAAHIAELRLEDRVKMVGTLSEKNVFGLLSAADAFVLPSIGAGEAWPVSLMEAMGAGLPVISSIIGATPEMIVSGQDGVLVAQADEQGLARALLLLARDVEARRQMGARARATAQRRFDVQATAGRLAATIRDALDPAARAAE